MEREVSVGFHKSEHVLSSRRVVLIQGLFQAKHPRPIRPPGHASYIDKVIVVTAQMFGVSVVS